MNSKNYNSNNKKTNKNTTNFGANGKQSQSSTQLSHNNEEDIDFESQEPMEVDDDYSQELLDEEMGDFPEDLGKCFAFILI
jgi:hypothetical protein